MAIVDLEGGPNTGTRALTATETLQEAGIERPSNAQAKECAGFLRQWLGEPKRINGRDKWHVPLRSGEGSRDRLTSTVPSMTKSKFD